MLVIARLLLVLAALALVGGCKKTDPECSALDSSGLPVRAGASAAPPPECTKTADCPRSCLCRDLGRCEKAEGGTCVVGETEHCERSRVCKLVGHCTLQGGQCVAGSDEDCKKSSMCENGGKCKAHEGRCVGDDGPVAP